MYSIFTAISSPTNTAYDATRGAHRRVYYGVTTSCLLTVERSQLHGSVVYGTCTLVLLQKTTCRMALRCLDDLPTYAVYHVSPSHLPRRELQVTTELHPRCVRTHEHRRYMRKVLPFVKLITCRHLSILRDEKTVLNSFNNRSLKYNHKYSPLSNVDAYVK